MLKCIFITFIFTLLTISNILNSKIIPKSEYHFPSSNGLSSTIGIFSIKNTPKKHFIKLRVKLKEPKSNAPKKFRHEYFQFHPSKTYTNKMAVIITGIGGNAKGNIANFMGRKFSKSGFHVLVVPSLFHKRFIYNTSSHGRVGFIREDAKDYYESLQRIIEYISYNYHYDIHEVSLLGYSLGGASAIFISREDSFQKKINFKNIIAINPPVRLAHGLNVIDNFKYNTTKMSKKKRRKIYFKWFVNTLRHSKQNMNVRTYKKFIRKIEKVSDIKKKYLIGRYLSSNLRSVIKAIGKVSNKKNIIKSSKKYKFKDYVNKILLPYYQNDLKFPELTFEKLSYLSSLMSIEDYLREKDNLFIMHNADDFLLKEGDINFLESAMKERAMLYPTGGHVGNIWYKDNIEQMIKWLKS